MAGRRLTGPVQGFGKMWQKTYRMDAGPDITPEQAIATWREHFPEFWPKGNKFAGALTGINPGDVALLDLAIGGGVKLSTGVFVLYADAESFTLMTPQGHMFAGWITFSAERAGDTTTVQAQVLMRANDPLYEMAMPGGHRKEDKFWVGHADRAGPAARHPGPDGRAPPAPAWTPGGSGATPATSGTTRWCAACCRPPPVPAREELGCVSERGRMVSQASG